MIRKCQHLLVLLLADVLRLIRRRQLWFLSDRLDGAGDNAEALFRHLRINRPDIDARFVLRDDVSSFERIKSIGPVHDPRSFGYKVLVFCADCLVSSQMERGFYFPLYRASRAIEGRLARIPFVFLQHGVTKDDLSSWIWARPRKINAILTVSKNERKAFLGGDYPFSPAEVWLTGFPRYDNLVSATEKCILVAPTWRQYLNEDNFAESVFCKAYAMLLSDRRLLGACRKTGWKIVFALHPNLAFAAPFFRGNDVVEILSAVMSYADCLNRAAVLVTDFSSLAFDFAYLGKRVIYAQFDGDEIFSGAHSYKKGYFDYVRDGFGPVVSTVDETIDEIVRDMESGAQLEEPYRRRADDFFAFRDSANCERVISAISDLLGSRRGRA